MSNTSTPKSDWWVDFVNKNPVPQESLDHFASNPWTNTFLSNPAYRPVPHFSRTLKATGEDYFFATTIAGPKTLKHYICLQRRDYNTVEVLKNLQKSGPSSLLENTQTPERPDCVFLLTAGPSGLDGHPGVLHGGVCCAILDESMGLVLLLHAHNIEGPTRQSSLYTAYLNVNYRAPVPTPGDLVVKAWLTQQQGKKWMVKAQILDQTGKVCTEAEGLWISTARTRL